MAFLNEQMMAKMAHEASVERHPLLKSVKLNAAGKMSYLEGCALASLLDDEKTSEKEYLRVREIGLSLELSEAEIDDCFKVVNSLSSDAEKNAFVSEMLNTLKEIGASKFFIDDFRSVLSADGKVDGKDMQMLDWFGTVLLGDAKWRQKENDKKVRKDVEKVLVELVEDDPQWPVNFDRESIRSALAECGVTEHWIESALGVLLPHAHERFNAVKAGLNRLEYTSSGNDRVVSLVEERNFLLLLNYLKCMDVCCSPDDRFSIVRDDSSDDVYSRWSYGSDICEKFYRIVHANCHVCLHEIRWAWRSKDGEANAKSAVKKIFADLLKEFERRSQF